MLRLGRSFRGARTRFHFPPLMERKQTRHHPIPRPVGLSAVGNTRFRKRFSRIKAYRSIGSTCFQRPRRRVLNMLSRLRVVINRNSLWLCWSRGSGRRIRAIRCGRSLENPSRKTSWGFLREAMLLSVSDNSNVGSVIIFIHIAGDERTLRPQC